MKGTCSILIHWQARSVGKNGVTCWVTRYRPLVGKYWYNIKTCSDTPMEVFNSHIPGKVTNHLHYWPKATFVNFNILPPHLDITYSSTTFNLHHLISYTMWQKGGMFKNYKNEWFYKKLIWFVEHTQIFAENDFFNWLICCREKIFSIWMLQIAFYL